MHIAEFVQMEIDSVDEHIIYEDFYWCPHGMGSKASQEGSWYTSSIFPFDYQDVADSWEESSLIKGGEEEFRNLGNYTGHSK